MDPNANKTRDGQQIGTSLFDGRQLVRGQTIVNLTHEERKALVCLLERRGEIVPYDDLIVAIWGAAQLREKTHEAVHRLVHEIKKHLGSDKTYISTCRGEGYELLAERTDVTEEGSKGWRWALQRP